MLLLSQVVMAQTTLQVSATVPGSGGLAGPALSLTVTTYNATSGAVIGSPSTSQTSLPFGALTYASATGTYTPSVYYGIAISESGGAGPPIVNVTYDEGAGTACPNIAAGTSVTLGCLGTKSTATFVTANSSNNVETISSLGKKRLIDLTGTAGELSTIPSGQYEKVYVGLWNGNASDSPADPANGKPFTNADAAGAYSGTLTFTVVTF